MDKACVWLLVVFDVVIVFDLKPIINKYCYNKMATRWELANAK